MITEYTTVSAIDPEDLHERVNGLISEGWQPFGGVSISWSTREAPGYQGVWRTYISSSQAMVKLTKEETTNE